MNRVAGLFLVSLFLPPLAGCDSLPGFLQLRVVTVSLVNNSDSPVDVTIYISDQQAIPEFLLTSVGTKLEFTVGAHQTTSFSRDCDELQAFKIEEAVLQSGVLEPTTDSDLLRDGTDFNCRDTIVATFSHSLILIDFDVTVDVQDN